MFPPTTGPRVSLGGRSRQESSREELLQKSREERRKRQRLKQELDACKRIQSALRGYLSRRSVRSSWLLELRALLASAPAVGSAVDDIIGPKSRVISLFCHAYDASDPDHRPLLVEICKRILAFSMKGTRAWIEAWVAHSGAQQALILQAGQIVRFALATLTHQREAFCDQLLVSGDWTALPTASEAYILLRCTRELLRPKSWVITSLATAVWQRCLCAQDMLLQLACLLASVVPKGNGKEEKSALQTFTSDVLYEYQDVSENLAKEDLVASRPWVMLCVPNLRLRSPCLGPDLERLASLALLSVVGMASTSLLPQIAICADKLGYASNGAPGTCGLQLLANLLQSISSRTKSTSVVLQAPGAVCIMRLMRCVLASLSREARHLVARQLLGIAATKPTTTRAVKSAPVGAGEEADVEIFSGWEIATPVFQGSPVLVDAAASVSITIGLGDTAVIDTLAHAMLQEGAGTFHAGAQTVLYANELALFLYTALSLCKGEQLERQAFEAAWAAPAVGVTRFLWLHAMRPMLARALAAGVYATADRVAALEEHKACVSWGLPSMLPPWLLPATVLSALYSRYASTTADAMLFDEKAPIPLSELGDAPSGFVSVLRDALFQTFLRRNIPSSLVVWTASGDEASLMPMVNTFKLSAGELLTQLHARAARVPAVPDTWFHAPGLQQGQLLRDVMDASRRGADVLMDDGDAEEDEDVMAQRASYSAYIEVLRYAPCLIAFHLRAQVFQHLIEIDQGTTPHRQVDPAFAQVAGMFGMDSRAFVSVTVKRGHTWEDAFEELQRLEADRLKARMRVQFVSEHDEVEAGVDGGGLFKEFIESVMKEAFDPAAGMFLVTEANELYPHPHAACTPHSALRLRVLGSLLGKALYEGLTVEVPLAGFFLKKVRGASCDINDLPSLDPQLQASLLSIAAQGAEVEKWDLRFTIAPAMGGPEVPLCEVKGTTEMLLQVVFAGGQDMQVTRKNVAMYVNFVANFRLNRELAAPAAAFLSGLTALVPRNWLRMFNDRELQQLIAGSAAPGLDVHALRDVVEYGGGYHEEHPVILRLWHVLSELDTSQQAAFLKFVTGCSRPPLLGFQQLQPRMAVHMRGHVGNVADASALPTASTCFNLLKLPPYTSERLLRDKLLLAILAGTGFELS